MEDVAAYEHVSAARDKRSRAALLDMPLSSRYELSLG